MSSPSKEAPEPVRVEGGALVIGAERVPFFAGAFHYFRTPRSEWRRALLHMRDMGLTLVDIYAPWGVHEIAPGAFDFGEQDDRKDIVAFIRLAQTLELQVVLRPGPHINAELNGFGLPDHVLSDPEVRALSPQGHAVPLPAPPISFPVPSHDSKTFQAGVERWFRVLADKVGPLIYPQGPVVAVQVDNEAAFYFRDAPYDQDYHPEAIARYQAFLKKRYKKLSTIQEAYGISVSKWRDVEPPRRFAARNKKDLRVHFDWLESQEAGLLEGLGAFREELVHTGLAGDALLTHNMPMGDGLLPLGPATLERKVGAPGTDYYERRSEFPTVKRRTLRLAGNVVFPFAAELGLGASPWLPPRKDRDSLHVFLCALAFGLRGFNLYMAVDRDRWYGGALDSHGGPTPLADDLRRLIHCLTELRFWGLRRTAKVGIVLPRIYRRMSRMTHTLSAMSPALMEISGIGVAACRQDTFGFSRVIQQHWRRWVDGAAQLLDRLQFPYVYVDSDVDSDRLSEFSLLLCPTFALADAELCDLIRRAQNKGLRTGFGPDRPESSPGGVPLGFDADPSAFGLIDLAVEDDRARLATYLDGETELASPFRVVSGGAEVTVHEDNDGPKVAFLINTSGDDTVVHLQLPTPARLVDLLDGDAFEGEALTCIPLRRNRVRALRVQPVAEARRQQASEADHAE